MTSRSNPFVFTVDVERVADSNYGVPTESFQSDSQELERQLVWILRALVKFRVRGTFFVLASCVDEVSRAFDVVPEAKAHVEIAYHSWDHRSMREWAPEEWQERAQEFQKLILKRFGQKVFGFRAPSWSLSPDVQLWLYPALAQSGFSYSSSEFKFRTHLYGPVTAETHSYRRSGILEFPVFPESFCGVSLPYSGGAYARVLPLPILTYLFSRRPTEFRPKVLYIHPREIDPASRRLALGPIDSMIHHVGLKGLRSKIEHVLGAYPWQSFTDILPNYASIQ